MLFGVDADDRDPQDLELTIVALPEHGELRVDGKRISIGDRFNLDFIIGEALTYTHDESETSLDRFFVSLTDGGEDGSQAASGVFNLTITEVVDPPPVVNEDQLTLAFGQSFDSRTGDLLQSGFGGLNRDSLSADAGFIVTLEVPPSQGTLELYSDGTFSYVHDGSRVYLDEFSYRVTNEDGVFTIATVTISIEPPVQAAFPSPLTDAGSAEEPNQQNGEPTLVEEVRASLAVESGDVDPKSATVDSKPQAIARAQSITALNEEFRGPQALLNQSAGIDDNTELLAVTQHRKNSLLALTSDRLSVSDRGSVEILLEVKLPTTSDAAANPYFLEGLSKLQNDLDEAHSQAGQRVRLAEETVLAASLTASVGAISWALRSGALLASLMTAGPLWWCLDPGKVIITSAAKNRREEPDSSTDDDKLEKIFEQEKQVSG